MAYAQWVNIEIEGINCPVKIKNVHLSWGKFYQHGNKDAEIPTSQIDNMEIASGQTGIICSCGRSDSASGTEGSFDLHDASNDKHIGSYYWDCPWGSKHNTSTLNPDSRDYIIQQEGANLYAGALGNVRIKIYKIK